MNSSSLVRTDGYSSKWYSTISFAYCEETEEKAEDTGFALYLRTAYVVAISRAVSLLKTWRGGIE